MAIWTDTDIKEVKRILEEVQPVVNGSTEAHPDPVVRAQAKQAKAELEKLLDKTNRDLRTVYYPPFPCVITGTGTVDEDGDDEDG